MGYNRACFKKERLETQEITGWSTTLVAGKMVKTTPVLKVTAGFHFF